MAETEERWVVAANVKAPGTKHFVAGAKVFVSMGGWGDGGERCGVYGRHRGGMRYISLVMPSKRLENFRPTLYVGHGVEGRWRWPGGDWSTVLTKAEASQLAAQYERASRGLP